MFKIAICDDEAVFIHELKNYPEKYAAETGSNALTKSRYVNSGLTRSFISM